MELPKKQDRNSKEVDMCDIIVWYFQLGINHVFLCLPIFVLVLNRHFGVLLFTWIEHLHHHVIQKCQHTTRLWRNGL